MRCKFNLLQKKLTFDVFILECIEFKQIVTKIQIRRIPQRLGIPNGKLVELLDPSSVDNSVVTGY